MSEKKSIEKTIKFSFMVSKKKSAEVLALLFDLDLEVKYRRVGESNEFTKISGLGSESNLIGLCEKMEKGILRGDEFMFFIHTFKYSRVQARVNVDLPFAEKE